LEASEGMRQSAVAGRRFHAIKIGPRLCLLLLLGLLFLLLILEKLLLESLPHLVPDQLVHLFLNRLLHLLDSLLLLVLHLLLLLLLSLDLLFSSSLFLNNSSSSSAWILLSSGAVPPVGITASIGVTTVPGTQSPLGVFENKGGKVLAAELV
jgi:hypothetical protein